MMTTEADNDETDGVHLNQLAGTTTGNFKHAFVPPRATRRVRRRRWWASSMPKSRSCCRWWAPLAPRNVSYRMLTAVHRHLDAFVAAFLRANAAAVIQNYAARHCGDEARVACRLLGVARTVATCKVASGHPPTVGRPGRHDGLTVPGGRRSGARASFTPTSTPL